MKVHELDWEVNLKSYQVIKQHFQSVEGPLRNKYCHISKLRRSVSLNSGVFWKIHIVSLSGARSTESQDLGTDIDLYHRVVTRYMGSGIKGQKKGGIRDHSPGIWDHKPRDRDQRCFSLDQGSGVVDQILRDKGSKFSSRLEPGIKNLGKITGSAMKKYTSLRPCVSKWPLDDHRL